MNVKNIKIDLLLNMYRTMYKIRKFEEAVVDFCLQDIVRGAAHLYLGEEAKIIRIKSVNFTDMNCNRNHYN